ncbi:MAG: small acid-soluble spore protein SspI [Candidatus Pristimantibacillus lignocellulolyticus]|uniref:Small, acid-soluble spore protein I n=1 Tax=Candidatus Pristimantibacillus lignocellulolyticus TaxID=2994561 RepID=A0A9J6Z9E3_9BACL|nr:MAG: small acid-soluble spore protein SspI [Candidatus Pristimantibacillus lignocellulolyticus]
MQNFDLRQAIIQRVQDNSKAELNETITDSVNADERALPGLGVLFEIIWKDSNEALQSSMVNTLFEHLQSDHNSSTASPSY